VQAVNGARGTGAHGTDRERGRASTLLGAGVAAALLAVLAPAPTYAQMTPPILQITIERVAAGRESEYGRVEERLLEACLRLGCPNDYLALESVAEPREIWWLVAYSSQADVDRVAQAYARNDSLTSALRELGALKKDIAPTIGSWVTRYRPDLGAEVPWRVGVAPFAVLGRSAAPGSGAVFEAPDGMRFTVVAAATLDDANAVAARSDPSARVFTVRPEWSKPDPAWLKASPELWRTGTQARSQR